MAFSLGEYQDIFLEEADEQLQELNQNLLELEKNPDNIEIINDIFRAAHSLKSSAGFVGLNELSNLAHKMENLLQGIRDGMLKVTPEIIDVIFKCFDEITSIIDTIASGEQPTQDLTWIIDEIQNVSKGSQPSRNGNKPQAKDRRAADKSAPVGTMQLSDEEKNEIARQTDEGHRCYEIALSIDKTAQMKWVKAQLVIANLAKIGRVIRTFPSPGDLGDDETDVRMKILFCSSSPLESVRVACNIDLVHSIEYSIIAVMKGDDGIKFKADKPVVLFGDEFYSQESMTVAEKIQPATSKTGPSH